MQRERSFADGSIGILDLNDGVSGLALFKLCHTRRMHTRCARIRLFVLFTCFFIFFNVCSYIGLIDILRQESFSHFTYPLEIDLVPVVRQVRKNWLPKDGTPLRLYSNQHVRPINSADFPYRIRNRSRCPSGRVDIIVLVKSALENRKHRTVLRRTWMNTRNYRDSKFVVCPVFLLGTQPDDSRLQAAIDEEQRTHGDLVQFEFVDTYFNNTYKTMLGFRWAIETMPHARYMFFTDDDYYVNLWNLWSFVNSPTLQKTRVIAGFIWDSSMPKRLRFSKWHISLEEYPYVRWPSYPTAGSYVLTMDTAIDVYIAMHYTKYLRFDDVFVGIVAHKLNIPTLHNASFVGSTLYPIKASVYKNVIACHMVSSPERVQLVWENSFGKTKPL